MGTGYRASGGRLLATLTRVTNEERAQRALVRVHQAHSALLSDLDEPVNPARPSELPGWSLGHLLTHLARNADSVTRRLAAAGRGEHAHQYEGGLDGRVAEIDAGAQRSWAELRDDVEESCRLLESTAAGLAPEAWGVESTTVTGLVLPAATVLERRVREVVIHHTDLGLSFTPAAWPDDLVDELNDELVASLRSRADAHALAGWLTGRAPAPFVAPWS